MKGTKKSLLRDHQLSRRALASLMHALVGKLQSMFSIYWQNQYAQGDRLSRAKVMGQMAMRKSTVIHRDYKGPGLHQRFEAFALEGSFLAIVLGGSIISWRGMLGNTIHERDDLVAL